MNPSTLRAASKLNLIRILSAHPEGMSLEELQKITGHKSITELKNELGELYMIEMYPYSPQDFVDIDFDGEKVRITVPISVDKALALSPSEWILLREMVTKSDSVKSQNLSDSILAKINSVIPSGNWEPNEKIKSLLIKSISEKSIIKISYWKRDTKDKEVRSLQPWILWEENDSYLLGYDLEKKGFRSFRLDCILGVEITTEKAKDLPKDAKDWLDGFTQLLHPESKKEDLKALVYCTDSSAYHLGQKLPMKDLGSSKTIENAEYFLYEVPIKLENWFIEIILGYGKSVIVVSPKELKEKILLRIKEGISNFT